ncbi:unnamed protein product [Arabidopsis thaliana]|uniref:Uncharacterized protein n=1 Tax=Arabidopsis thaliana TaxID=3702 RepID=Q9LJ75_ARATH|nr:unnamed protein product [Arabidopsis thaliana]
MHGLHMIDLVKLNLQKPNRKKKTIDGIEGSDPSDGRLHGGRSLRSGEPEIPNFTATTVDRRATGGSALISYSRQEEYLLNKLIQHTHTE